MAKTFDQDMLFSDPESRDWENILRRCSQGGESCRTFGIEEWPLASKGLVREFIQFGAVTMATKEPDLLQRPEAPGCDRQALC